MNSSTFHRDFISRKFLAGSLGGPCEAVLLQGAHPGKTAWLLQIEIKTRTKEGNP